MAINSAQGIASLFRGNPEQLQQSMQKEQQAKPGLPPDLQKMLALQIVTNEKDSATAQKAMDQLQQMSGQGGKPPTVMASLQQQAEQKLQAKAVQDQQKKQGIQSLMQNVPASGVPEGTPEPEMQPEAQGIDQSDRVAFAGAEGGIVSFQSQGEVPPADIDARYDRETNELGEGKRTQYSPEVRAYVAQKEQKERAEQDAYLKREQARQLAGNPMMNRQSAQAAPATPVDVDNQSAAETARLQRQKTLPQAPAPVPVAAPAKDLKTLAAQKVPVPAPVSTATQPAGEAAPKGSTAAAYSDYLNRALTTNRDTERAAEEARYATVGKQDTSQIDRMIAELEKRKQELAPKQGFEGLMEYLAQVSANSQPGRGSGASGAAGARALDKINNDRRAQQFELTKQGVELAQKKLDSDRAFSLDKYKAGQEGAKRIDDVAKDAAKEFGLGDRNEKDLANRIKTQLLANQGSLAAASVRGSTSATLTPNQRAEIANKAIDNVNATLKANVPLQMKASKDPAYVQQLVTAETERLMAAAEGRTMSTAPGAGSPGGTTRMKFDANGNPIK